MISSTRTFWCVQFLFNIHCTNKYMYTK